MKIVALVTLGVANSVNIYMRAHFVDTLFQDLSFLTVVPRKLCATQYLLSLFGSRGLNNRSFHSLNTATAATHKVLFRPESPPKKEGDPRHIAPAQTSRRPVWNLIYSMCLWYIAIPTPTACCFLYLPT